MLYIGIITAVVAAIVFFKKPFWGLLFLVALIPFHAFLLTYGTHLLSLKDNTLFALWKEFILAVLFARIIFDALRAKKFPIKIIWADRLVSLLLVIALASILYGTKNVSQAVWGLRYDFEMFLVYFIARALVKDLKQIKRLFYVFLGSGAVVALFGIIQVLFLAPDFLARCCGYSYVLGWTPDKPLQASQVIPGANPGSLDSHRIISTLAGPNQLGIYLAVLVLLTAAAFFIAKNIKTRIIYLVLMLIYLVPIYFTYSRSAWLALIAGIVVIKLLIFGRIYLFWIIGGIGAIILAMVLILVYGRNNPFIAENILRATSSDHLSRIKDSLMTFIHHPFGLGIGKAGLVSLRFPKSGVLINESWHLQILTELGFLGFLVYVGIIVDYFRKFWRALRNRVEGFEKIYVLSALSILVAIIVHGFFLHTWTDITLVVVVWTIFGVAINIFQEEIQNNVIPSDRRGISIDRQQASKENRKSYLLGRQTS